MKLKTRIVCLTVALMLMLTQTVMASEFIITMTGTTDDNDIVGATVLVVNKGTNLSEVALSDVLHIDQTDIGDDGKFELLLPFSLDGEYDVYSNMSEFTLGEFEKTKVLYVSETGSDTNSGETADEPLATLSAAYESLWELKEIVVSGTVAYTDAPEEYEDQLFISGTEGAVLTLPSTVSLNGALSLDNITLSGASNIYANGKQLYIGQSVTTDTLLNVYGGKETEELVGDTNITILGGLYNKIYGGGKAAVNGNTNVVVGGTVNTGQTTGDGDTNAIYFYGGGADAAVTGETNIIFKDSAKVTKLYGAGSGAAGTAQKTNVFVQGGEVMNVFGGGTSAALTDCVTNVTITEGTAEAIFGGNENAPMSGNTNVNLFGGKVTRRVYSGCYNNGSAGLKYTYSSDYYVSGTTTLSIKPGVNVNSLDGLSGTNAMNAGLFAGSRTSASHSDEINTVIFLDGCYSTYSGEMGEQNGSIYTSYFKSFPNYLVDATTGGVVYGTTEGGKVYCVPDEEKYAVVNGTLCTDTVDGVISSNVTASINASSSTTNTVEFSKNFAIESLSAASSSNGVTADVELSAKNFWGETTPKIIVAIYDELSGNLLDCKMIDTTSDMTSQTFELDCKIVSGFTYIVKAMLWDADVKPLTTSYRITFMK